MNPKNPFYILELPGTASPGDIERQGRKLLGLFDVGAKKATTYTCALGTFPRDATMIREAMAALRDPKRRAKDGFLVSLLEGDASDGVRTGGDFAPDAPLPDAFEAAGYKGL